jgi:hypothetical protein
LVLKGVRGLKVV